MPVSLAEFSLISSPNGDGVLANGGIHGSDRQSSIYELVCPQSGCLWKELEQKLQVPRMNHVSTMLIPDEIELNIVINEEWKSLNLLQLVAMMST